MMEVKEAIALAKSYIGEVYADEGIGHLGLEEADFDETAGRWLITLGFSRPWTTPESRAQEVLQSMGAYSGLRRSFKVVTIAPDGHIVSMKDRMRTELAR